MVNESKINYLSEIKKAKREYANKWQDFWDVLDKWADANEKLGEFTIGLEYTTKQEVYLKFSAVPVIQEVVDKACEDFNLRVTEKITQEDYYHDATYVKFVLRNKDDPFFSKKGIYGTEYGED